MILSVLTNLFFNSLPLTVIYLNQSRDKPGVKTQSCNTGLGPMNRVTLLLFSSLLFALASNSLCLLFMLVRTGFPASWNHCCFLFYMYRIKHLYIENSYFTEKKQMLTCVFFRSCFSLTDHLLSTWVLSV